MKRFEEFKRTHPQELDESTVKWITQNNWILPIREDEEVQALRRYYLDLEKRVFAALGLDAPKRRNFDHVQWVREMALCATFAWERAPIWESMQGFFFDMFAWRKYSELKQLACQLGLPVKRSQAEQATVLIDYFNRKVGI